MSAWKIEQAEIVEWLRAYDGPRFHAVLSDPPYALISIAKRFGKEGSAPAQEGSDGRYSRLSGGFMGQRWDGFDSLDHYQAWVTEWASLLIEKALLPGAVALFFGGTRTFHRLGTGLEQGGFEIIDCLMWLHGQGFPKSHDVSKGLDKRRVGSDEHIRLWIERLGPREEIAQVARVTPRQVDHWIGKNTPCPQLPTADRLKLLCEHYGDWPEWISEMLEVKGPEIGEVTHGRSGGDDFAKRPGFEATHRTVVEYAPGTDEARLWDGYGTALKPAWEPVFLCRAPRGGKTFAQLAVEHGTGALNIDGSRIAHGESEERMYPRSSVYGKTTYANAKLSDERDGSEELASPNSLGRWPANLVLCHHPDCQKVGETQVKGRTINRFKQGMMPFGNAEGEEYESEQMPDEKVERWACVPECPIRLLDDQAGRRTSGNADILHAAPADTYSGGWPGGDREGATFGDSGGVSRFFYCSKASRAEKDLGLEDFYWKRTGTGFLRISPDDWEKLPKRERARGCIHPTVKPLDLLRYLAKLVLPPPTPHGRRILVPFSGSGSEVIGAVQAGWDEAVAVEMEPIYNEMAEARIGANLGML